VRRSVNCINPAQSNVQLSENAVTVLKLTVLQEENFLTSREIPEVGITGSVQKYLTTRTIVFVHTDIP
jgi:hypothetical protein